MLIDKQENITILTQEDVSLNTYVSNLRSSYEKVKNDHLILNLLSLSKLKTDDLMEFFEVSRDHKAKRKSFVIVTASVNLNDVHEKLTVAPTLKEAYDIIEMEDIERDLDF
ncbi:ribonuclease Z [Galbibacter sp. EGI 63066]|uniref:ribonuclease Z n=1 Tax=Galbibacter sp. EGI 63066 TaxID=2993559 RepID=UPI002248CDFA|nr:ribonuclease Z [Galbibacter sp. EGI 63066]MCX2680900.1 ribonuclease Z [Galbibacter sp. EGI 63066]